MKSKQPYVLDAEDVNYRAIMELYPEHTKMIVFPSVDLESSFRAEVFNWSNTHKEEGSGRFNLDMQKFHEYKGKITGRMMLSLEDLPPVKTTTYAFTEDSYSKIEEIVKKYIL
ncbi:MAG: hypothetical protein ACP5N2_05545 [Candidatus Nanoarchaeia archaeon]